MESAAPADAARWALAPDILHLNHGSFGACTRAALAAQAALRDQLEAAPTRFFVRDFEPLLDDARRALAGFVGAAAEDLAFVTNVTHGVNAVLRSQRFRAGDQVLVTDHGYNACTNAARAVAADCGLEVVVARLPWPLRDDDHDGADVIAAILAAVTPRTRLALIDHVTSATALVLDIATIIAELARRGVDTLVDGAHAPGMLPLAIDGLGAAYYVGNCHKWMCAPKGVAFVHARRDRRDALRPTVISHGASALPGERSRFQQEFDWTGTCDPSAVLALPAAITALADLRPGGWPALLSENRTRAHAARVRMCARLGVAPPCPPAWLGAMAAVAIPDGDARGLQRALFAPTFGKACEVAVSPSPWPDRPGRLLRFSLQAYVGERDVDDALDAVVAALAAGC